MLEVSVQEHLVEKLTKDVKQSVVELTVPQVRYLVDTYYQLQEVRKASANQGKSLEKSQEPHGLVTWLEDNMARLEGELKKALGAYSQSTRLGQWAESHVGVGPVLSAGLMAHIDIEKAPHLGHILSFGGHFSKPWEKGQKRPFNMRLKVLFWKLGQSFLKQSGHEDCFYGHELKKRWEVEWELNTSGKLALAAEEKLKKFNVDKATEAYLWYAGEFSPGLVKRFRERGVKLSDGTTRRLPTSREVEALQQGMLEGAKADGYVAALKAAGYDDLQGVPHDRLRMLPPAHVLARACRWAVKIFMSHWHHVAYVLKYGTAPARPWVLEQGGHADMIPVQHWPLAE